MQSELVEIIKREQDILSRSKNPNERVNILYNLILIKCKNNDYKKNIYVDIKALINDYTELVKINDFGYDSFCTEKILRIINYLSLNEQQSVLNYLFSTLTRELPEIEKDWVQDAIKRVKIKKIIHNREYWNFPNAFLLFSALSIPKLIIALSLFTVLIGIILLPAPTDWMAIFKVKYAIYSDSFYFNHLLNIISLFGGFKDGCEVIALNPLGLIVQLIGKVLFIILIVNFIYKKISDKISLR